MIAPQRLLKSHTFKIIKMNVDKIKSLIFSMPAQLQFDHFEILYKD